MSKVERIVNFIKENEKFYGTETLFCTHSIGLESEALIYDNDLILCYDYAEEFIQIIGLNEEEEKELAKLNILFIV